MTDSQRANERCNDPVILGLIGGIASGKSMIASLLYDRGAAIIDADRLGHEVLMQEDIIRALVARFGPGILSESGAIDRSKLGKLVFADTDGSKQNRIDLEGIVHPRIKELGLAAIQQLRQRGDCKMIVLDAPLLLEAGWDEFCDWVVFVDTPIELRQEWASRRGWSEDELARREANQLPIPAKIASADFIIHNSLDWDVVTDQVDTLWNHFLL